MATFTPELKEQLVQEYLDSNPTPETSIEIVQELAELHGVSPNGVRLILVEEEVYLKKEVVKKEVGTKASSKDESIAALKKAIGDMGKEVNDAILDKLTGKAAVYLLTVLK